MIPVYNSPAEAAAAHKAAFPKASAVTSADAWTGNSGAVTIQRALTGGFSEHIPEAEKLMEKLQDAMPASWRDVWTRDVAGAFPDVPSYLAGDPECMFRRLPQNQENHPVKVVVCLTSSGAVNNSILIRRGVAVLALSMALQAIRGCQLYVCGMLGPSGVSLNHSDPHAKELGGGVALCRIPSDPLSLTEACFALCDGGFGRGIMNNLAANHGTGGTLPDDGGFTPWTSRFGFWPRRFNYNNPTPFMNKLRDLLGFEEDAVMVAPALYSDGDLTVKDPITWVRQKLVRYLPQDVAA